MKKRRINVKGAEIAVFSRNQEDYISLTDMVKNFGDESIIYNWLRNRNTIEFLGIWEQLYNPDFNPVEFERFKSQAGLNRFTLSPRSGLRQPTQSACLPRLAGMAAAPTPIKISPSSSARGSAPNSSSI